MFRFIIVLVAFVLIGSLVVMAQRVEVPPQPNMESRQIAIPPAKQMPRAKRLREGTAFKDKHVVFKQTGDRTVLYTVEDNQRFTCLENLALERVLTAVQEKPERKFWNIEGEFTEFRGENFVFIRRAVVAQDPTVSIPSAP